jgi:hypothetical protein
MTALYAYVLNNPLTLSDPLGLWTGGIYQCGTASDGSPIFCMSAGNGPGPRPDGGNGSYAGLGSGIDAPPPFLIFLGGKGLSIAPSKDVPLKYDIFHCPSCMNTWKQSNCVVSAPLQEVGADILAGAATDAAKRGAWPRRRLRLYSQWGLAIGKGRNGNISGRHLGLWDCYLQNRSLYDKRVPRMKKVKSWLHEWQLSGEFLAALLFISARYTIWPLFLWARNELALQSGNSVRWWCVCIPVFAAFVWLVMFLGNGYERYSRMSTDALLGGALFAVAAEIQHSWRALIDDLSSMISITSQEPAPQNNQMPMLVCYQGGCIQPAADGGLPPQAEM